MKKLLLILLCLILVSLATGCGQHRKFTPSAVKMEVVESSVSPSGVTVRIDNQSKTDIAGGIEWDFALETKANEEWTPVKAIREVPTSSETYIFSQGARELEIHWTKCYGTLAPGEYRIIKHFTPCSVDRTDEYIEGFDLTAAFVIE